MPSDDDPITDDELLYRRVLRNYCDFACVDVRLRVDRQAFVPSSDDDEGLSFFRAVFVDPEEVARDKNGELGRYCIPRLSVAGIRRLGLSVEPTQLTD